MNAGPDLGAFQPLLQGALGPLVSLAIPAARMLGVFTVLPIFTRLGVTGLLRGGVALALALPLAPGLQAAAEGALRGGGAALTLLLVKEAVVGLVIGLVAGVPFWAAQAAGELLDQQRGSQSALLPDPSGGEAGVTGTLLLLASVTVFLGAGGLRRLQEGVFESYALWPAASLLPAFSAEAGLRTLGVLDRLLAGGLVLASPLLVAMLLAEFALGLASRFAPQLNVFDLAMAVKGIVHAVGLPIYALVLVSYLEGSLAPLARLAAELRGFAP